MQISAIRLLTQPLITTNNIYCAQTDTNSYSYKYTIKECSVAMKSQNVIEVDIHVVLFPTTQGTKIVLKKPSQKIFNWSEGTNFPLCLSYMSINNGQSSFGIVNGSSKIIGGTLKLPELEEQGFHIKYKYENNKLFLFLKDNGIENYEIEFEIVYNSDYIDKVDKQELFDHFCHEYSNHKNFLLLENKIYKEPNTTGLGTLLKLKPQTNQSGQSTQSGEQTFTIIPSNDDEKSAEETNTQPAETSERTSIPIETELPHLPKGGTQSNPTPQNITREKARKRTKTLSNYSQSLGRDSFRNTRSSFESSFKPSFKSQKRRIQKDFSNKSSVKKIVQEKSSDYEYKPINFFSTVAGVTMLVQSIIVVIIILLPMIYKLICIYLD